MELLPRWTLSDALKKMLWDINDLIKLTNLGKCLRDLNEVCAQESSFVSETGLEFCEDLADNPEIPSQEYPQSISDRYSQERVYGHYIDLYVCEKDSKFSDQLAEQLEWVENKILHPPQTINQSLYGTNTWSQNHDQTFPLEAKIHPAFGQENSMRRHGSSRPGSNVSVAPEENQSLENWLGEEFRWILEVTLDDPGLETFGSLSSAEQKVIAGVAMTAVGVAAGAAVAGTIIGVTQGVAVFMGGGAAVGTTTAAASAEAGTTAAATSSAGVWVTGLVGFGTVANDVMLAAAAGALGLIFRKAFSTPTDQ